MEHIDLDKYKQAWKKESGKISGGQRLSESDIKHFLAGRSKDMSRLFKTGLYVDIAQKFIYSAGYAVLVFILETSGLICGISVILMIISAILLGVQLRYLLTFPDFEIAGNNLRTIIQSKIQYFNNRYKIAVYLGAASAPLFFLCGTLYYFFFKYGHIRTFQIDDFMVFGSGIILSYVISLASNVWQFRFHIKQLKTCLQEIDEEVITGLTIKQQKIRRIRFIIIAVLLLIAGILFFTYLLYK